MALQLGGKRGEEKRRNGGKIQADIWMINGAQTQKRFKWIGRSGKIAIYLGRDRQAQEMKMGNSDFPSRPSYEILNAQLFYSKINLYNPI